MRTQLLNNVRIVKPVNEHFRRSHPPCEHSYWITLVYLVEVTIHLRAQFEINFHELVFQKVSKFYEPAGRVKFELFEKLTSEINFNLLVHWASLHRRNPRAIRHWCAQRCDSDGADSNVTALIVTALGHQWLWHRCDSDVYISVTALQLTMLWQRWQLTVLCELWQLTPLCERCLH